MSASENLTSPAARPRNGLRHGRWLALAGILLAAFNLRTAVTSLTPLLQTVGEAFGFGSAVTGVVGMLPTASFAFFGVMTARIVHRLGLERTTALAMALATAGLLARGFVQGTTGLIVTSLLALAGMGIGNVALPPLVKRHYPHRVGALSSLYITLLQLGTMLPAFAAVPLANAYGWRVSLASWSVASLVALAPWVVLLRQQGHAHGGDLPDTHPPPKARAWHSGLGWAMCAMFGVTSLATYSMFTWLPRWFVEAGATPQAAGNLLGVYSAVLLPLALLVPLVATRMRRPFLIVLAAIACYAVGFVGMLWKPLAFPNLWAGSLGMAGMTFPLGLVLINLRTRTPAGSAMLSSFVQGVGYTLACLGPLLFGLLHEWSGHWAWPVAFLGLCILALAWGGWQACRPRYLEDEWLPCPMLAPSARAAD
ncbi:MAG TPA: MFS transporter [Pseudoxanthomonas sp.]|nr:MFS transporter [Pseudoxanthomonas sp.]